MKRTKKRGRGQAFSEGTPVRSLWPQDDGATGVVIRSSKRKAGWQYTVFFDSLCKAADRREEELEEML